MIAEPGKVVRRQVITQVYWQVDDPVRDAVWIPARISVRSWVWDPIRIRVGPPATLILSALQPRLMGSDDR